MDHSAPAVEMEEITTPKVPPNNECSPNGQKNPTGEAAKNDKTRFHVGRPRRYKTPEEFLERAEEYLRSCYNDTGEMIKPLTITGMCNFLGTTRERLLGYENGILESLKDGNGDDELFRDAVKRVKHVCQEYAENHGFMARNPAFAIFAL